MAAMRRRLDRAGLRVEPWMFDRAVVQPDPAVFIGMAAASGLQYPPMVPIWGEEAITIQPVRAGFPCLAAALIGYVEATREDDVEKNRVCLPSPLWGGGMWGHRPMTRQDEWGA